MASILPEHFSLPGASCPSLSLAEIENLSSGQPSCGLGAQGPFIQEKIFQGFSPPFSLLPLPEVICHLGFCPCLPGPSWTLAELCSGVLPSRALSLCTAKGSKDSTVRQIQTIPDREQRRFWSEMQQDLQLDPSWSFLTLGRAKMSMQAQELLCWLQSLLGSGTGSGLAKWWRSSQRCCTWKAELTRDSGSLA